ELASYSSSSAVLRLLFKTDGNQTGKGFTLRYKQIPCSLFGSGNYAADEGQDGHLIMPDEKDELATEYEARQPPTGQTGQPGKTRSDNNKPRMHHPESDDYDSRTNQPDMIDPGRSRSPADEEQQQQRNSGSRSEDEISQQKH